VIPSIGFRVCTRTDQSVVHFLKSSRGPLLARVFECAFKVLARGSFDNSAIGHLPSKRSFPPTAVLCCDCLCKRLVSGWGFGERLRGLLEHGCAVKAS